MLLKDIIDLAIERLELQKDMPIRDTFKSYINEGYMKFNKENASLIVSYVPIINGIAKLPENLIDIVDVKPQLVEGDKRIGNSIMTSQSGLFTITHSYYEDAMETEEDEPSIPYYLHSHLASYCCYKCLQNKAPNVATGFLNEFEVGKEEYKQLNKKASLGKNIVKDAYGEFGLWGE
ncbi:MAG: hypothetical protein ACRDA5_02390 [Clostridium sp.]